MNVIRNLLLLMVLVLALANNAVAANDNIYKIGFVNTARVLKEAPQARRVEERLKAEFEPRQELIRKKREEILRIEDQLKADDKLESDAKLMTAAERRKREREIRLKVSQLKFLEQEFREDQNLRRNEEIRELQQVVAKVLEQLGDSGDFDLILTEGVSYVSEQVDITVQVIEMLKQQAESAESTQ